MNPIAAPRLRSEYWVLDYNLAVAKRQFKQVDTILTCFEHWMGPYPFYEDSYKVVEAPHPGMEHQSAIAYGNGFVNGLNGHDLSGTGWGLKWDFILVHETAHEWFGNSITAKGDGDSWIHEAFAKYAETLYATSVSGKAAGDNYAIGIRKRIKNDEPILSGDTQDKYNKGSAMLHMIRQILGDEAFRALLRGLNRRFYHQTVSTAELTAFCSRFSGNDLSKIFDQYLTTTQIPVFEYAVHGGVLRYRWTNCVKGFELPPPVTVDGEKLRVDRNYYVKLSSVPAF
jgi:aminopeptidase N